MNLVALIGYLFVFQYTRNNELSSIYPAWKGSGFDNRFPSTYREKHYDFLEQYNKLKLLNKLKNNDTSNEEKLSYLEETTAPKPANLTAGGLLDEWNLWGVWGNNWEM
jgi:hypothetical protein